MRSRRCNAAAIAAVLVVGLSACQDLSTVGPTPDVANVRVLLTDAPLDYIDSAWVDIGAVSLVPSSGEGGSVVPLTDDGTDGMVNLLDFEGPTTSQLADAEIDESVYAQLRLVVDSARVVLKDGYEFRDGTTTKSLTVPSGAQTGIRLNLHDDEGEPGVLMSGDMVLVLDFDVGRSFVAQGTPDTAGIFGMIFTPAIRVAVEEVAGTISGTVTGAADSIDVAELTVTAEPVGAGLLEEYQTETATAQTDAAGDFTIHFVVPGDYTVTVDVADGFIAHPESHDVAVGKAEAVVDIDFEVDEDPGGG